MKNLLLLVLASTAFAQSLPSDPPPPPAPSATSSPNHKACYAAYLFWRDTAYALRNQIAAGSTAPIPQPTAVTASVSGSVATIVWKYDASSPYIAGFRVERANGNDVADSDFQTIAILGATLRTVDDKTLIAGQTYTYRVRAYMHSFSKQSDPSNVATATAQ